MFLPSHRTYHRRTEMKTKTVVRINDVTRNSWNENNCTCSFLKDVCSWGANRLNAKPSTFCQTCIPPLQMSLINRHTNE